MTGFLGHIVPHVLNSFLRIGSCVVPDVSVCIKTTDSLVQQCAVMAAFASKFHNNADDKAWRCNIVRRNMCVTGVGGPMPPPLFFRHQHRITKHLRHKIPPFCSVFYPPPPSFLKFLGPPLYGSATVWCTPDTQTRHWSQFMFRTELNNS
jgi:hypothetical protein